MLRTKQFRNYEILRKLGRGMTDVYLAFDTEQNRHAVLKIVEESNDALTKVVMEAERRGAALQKQLHEFDARVVEIYEFGDFEGYFFISMQYIEGKNIAEILREEKRMLPPRAAKIALEICSQLDRLHSFTADIDGHRRAIVHGDIKPSNIQIGLNDEVRLLDFGIAKAITFTHNLTHHTFGSPSYCSPERLAKAQVDSHADLWALGVTLYEMVAGMPPYQAETTRKLEALIQSRRPPRALPEDCPEGLKAIITKALAGDLHQRYASAASLRDDLQAFLMERPTSAEKQRRVAWSTNETIEKPRVDNVTIDRKRAFRKGVSGPVKIEKEKVAKGLALLSALLFGILAGLVLFFPAAYYYKLWKESAPLRTNTERAAQDWDLYKRLSQHGRWLGSLSPVAAAAQPLRASYIAAADDVIERYRNGSDPSIMDFDWRKAGLCLEHALEIEPHDPASRGKLALCKGYVAMEQGGNPQTARQDLDEAATLQPKSVDPHLALARLYIYVLNNVGKGMAEFHAAQRLGYPLGPREMEQQADGYRLRALQELKDGALQLAQRDLERARQLYEPIAGYSNVSVALHELEEDDRKAAPVVKKPVVVKRRVALRRTRWQ